MAGCTFWHFQMLAMPRQHWFCWLLATITCTPVVGAWRNLRRQRRASSIELLWFTLYVFIAPLIEMAPRHGKQRVWALAGMHVRRLQPVRECSSAGLHHRPRTAPYCSIVRLPLNLIISLADITPQHCIHGGAPACLELACT